MSGRDEHWSKMTDTEFDILDELYFVKSFQELSRIFEQAKFDLQEELWLLINKKWVKVLDFSDKEVELTWEIFQQNKREYRFSATKKGLLVHNQI